MLPGTGDACSESLRSFRRYLLNYNHFTHSVMNIRHYAAILLAVLLSGSSAYAQKVEFYTPGTVRIVRDKGDSYQKTSLSVTAKPQDVKVSVSRRGDATIYRTSAMSVRVENGTVTFLDNRGRVLTREGESSFTPITQGPDKGSYRVGQTFSVEADEGIYGIGMLQNGKMSLRGEDRRMEQSNLEDFAHFYQTIKGYGIFWDNYSPTRLVTPEAGAEGYLALESEVGDCIDYYFIYGGDADGVIAGMRELTGQVPMFPLWTYGFHQCRERYKSQDELLEVVHKYRELGIPFDGIIQDWQYWGGNYNWNAMEFLNPEFPRPQQMIDEVHRQNAHMSISIWASFGPETKAFKELDQKGLLLDFKTWPESGLTQWPPRRDYPSGVRCYDVYSKEARDIYWKNLLRLHEMGIDAWWMDSTDPDQIDITEAQMDQLTAMGSYRRVRNAFPLMTVGGVYDSQRAIDDSKRVFILTRSYFAGQQRYGANTWSGDTGSSWNTFRAQVPLCLNYTLTANPNVNADIGGFFASSYSTRGFNSATRNPQFQELYVRWMQFGAFTPMMRSHGADIYRELYYFGKEGDPVYDALVDAVKLRYRFLPYIYSQSWQVTSNDDSFMRALFMDFKEDRNTWDNNREYLFGHNVLVCPVLDPLYTEEKVARSRQPLEGDYPAVDWSREQNYEVYLPAGADWYDYWTGDLIKGGRSLKASAPLSHCPLYIKAGSILPLGPAVQYANENRYQDIDIVVYPGADASFTLYEDEGDSYNYEKGAYSTIELKWNDRSRTLTIGGRKGSFEGMPLERTFNVKVVGRGEQSVRYDGSAVIVR